MPLVSSILYQDRSHTSRGRSTSPWPLETRSGGEGRAALWPLMCLPGLTSPYSQPCQILPLHNTLAFCSSRIFWLWFRTLRMEWRGRREGGSGRGTHVNLWLIHVNVWQKPLQYCKVISLQLIKINGGEKVFKKLDGWMASSTQGAWVWANSRRQWRTGKPGVLQSIGLQRVGHNWVPEQTIRLSDTSLKLCAQGKCLTCLP